MNNKIRIVSLAAVILFLAGIASAAPVLKQLPYTKSVALGSGAYTFRFSLWNAEAGGTQAWSEEQNLVLGTPVINTFLGKVKSLSVVDFTQQLWVQAEQKNADNSYTVLGTRDILTMSPYAMGSDTSARAPGYISAVTASTGLTGGGTDGDISVAFDTAFGDSRYVNENQASSVTGTMLVNGSVGTGHLANNSVTAAKLQSDAVNNANRAVGANHIQDGAVTPAKLGNLSVGTAAIQDNAVTSGKIADGAVGSNDLAAGVVTAAKLGSSAVTRSKLAGIVAVKVECNGDCGDGNLGQICDGASPGWQPIAVSCNDVKDASGGYACGGNNKCANIGVVRENPLGYFCDDTSGYDAIVYCMAP